MSDGHLSQVGVRPATFAQEAIWAEQELQAGGSNSGYFTVFLKGDLPEPVIQRACLAVVRRHEALRSLLAVERGRLVQLIWAAAPMFRYSVDDLVCRRGRETSAVRGWVRRYYGALAWDLTSEPPIRFHLLRHGPHRRTLAVIVHHIGFDGRSKFIFARDFARFTTSLMAGTEIADELASPPRRPLDDAASKSLLDEATQFCNQMGLTNVRQMNLPVVKEPTGERWWVGSTGRFDLAMSDRDELHRLAHEEGTTLFGGLLACLAVQLYGYGNPRPVVAITVDTGDAASAHIIGLDVNVIPIVLVPRPDDAFRAVLRSTRAVLRQVSDYRRLPFQHVLRASGQREGRHSPLSVVAVSYPHLPNDIPPVFGVEARWEFFEPNFGSTFDLTFQFRNSSDGCFGRIDYATGAVHPASARAMVRHFHKVLHSVVESPDRPVSRLRVLKPKAEIQVTDEHSAPTSIARILTRPATKVEAVVAGIWREVLGIDRLGVNEDFFELGGHSILATQMLARILDEFGVVLSLRDLFDRPTISDLGALLELKTANLASKAAPQ